jgi:cytochrome c553
MFGAALSASIHQPDAAAQSTSLKQGDELRPIYAKPEDIADGKEFAESSCAGCHGANGISSTTGIPDLAGQRPSYLLVKLKEYQTGVRTNAAMNTSVKFISDDALVKVAAYYASLDPAQPVPGRAASYIDPVQAGKTAAAACAGCHGETGVSKMPAIPSLIGQDPQYLASAMKAYRSGQRKNDTMKSMLAAVNDADINHLALFYALQPAGRAQTPATGDALAGKASTVGCAGCHGDQGVSGSPATPSLAGQDAQYLVSALRAYKSGGRADDTMKALAASVDDSALKDIAAYYAGLDPHAPNVRLPLSVQEWTQRCDRCHGTNGNSADARIPALAGQRTEYLQSALHDYQSGVRKNPEMSAMSSALSDEDIKNLATYYSHQKARAVVFMPVPGK